MTAQGSDDEHSAEQLLLYPNSCDKDKLLLQFSCVLGSVSQGIRDQQVVSTLGSGTWTPTTVTFPVC